MKVNLEDEAEYDIQETNTSPCQDVEGVTPLSHSINNGYLAILQDCITHSPQQVHGLWCTVSQTLGLSPMLPYQGNESNFIEHLEHPVMHISNKLI